LKMKKWDRLGWFRSSADFGNFAIVVIFVRGLFNRT
jgi:hypothetical protein